MQLLTLKLGWQTLVLIAVLTGALMPVSGNAAESGSGFIWQNTMSGITIFRVYSDWRSDYDVSNHTQGPIYYIDCADFRNIADQPIKHVQLAFALGSARTGVTSGTPLYLDIDENIARGNFANHSCLSYGYANGARGLTLFGWVNEVDFADGSSWHAAPAAVGSATNDNPMVKLANPQTYLPLKECDEITNVSGKTIGHLELEFTHTTLSGSVLGFETLESASSIPAGGATTLCRAFNGISRPDVLEYGYARFNNVPVQAPTIYYDGVPSQLHVVVRMIKLNNDWLPK